MIKANELRIGNLVNADYLCKVVGIDELGASLIDVNGDESSIVYLTDENIDPIPITEEWLLKFGFEGSNGYYLCPKWYKFRFQKNSIIKFKGLIFNNKKVNQLIYIHQLQNLYFAITGEELTINQ